MMMASTTQTIRVFPLGSVLLLPRGHLPLHIFEPRYRAMVEDALASDRRIGMVHPRVGLDGEEMADTLMPLGCIGEIRHCEALPDGRYNLVLEGTQKFRIQDELPLHPDGFRRVTIALEPDEESGGAAPGPLKMDRSRLIALANRVLPKHLALNLVSVTQLADPELVDALSMHIPLPTWDRQALLQAGTGQERADALLAALETADAIRVSAELSTRRH